MLLSNAKISHKIYLAGIIQFVLVAMVGFIGVNQMSKIGHEIVDIAEYDIPLSNSITELTESKLLQNILFEKIIFTSLLVERGRSGAKRELQKNRRDLNTLSTHIGNEIIDIRNFVKQSQSKLHSEQAIKKYEGIVNTLNTIEKHHKELAIQVTQLLDSMTEGFSDNIASRLLTLESKNEKAREELFQLLESIQSFTAASAIQAEHDEKSGLIQIISTLVIALMIGLILPTLVLHSMRVPILNLNNRLLEIAEGDGDLSVSLSHSANDELGQLTTSFNKLIQNLRRVILGVNSAADILGTSSESAINVMESTLVNVHNQLSETEKVADAVEKISETIKNVAKSTSEASSLAENVKERVAEGTQSAIDSQTIIESLATEVDNTSRVIKSLASETDNIGSVLDTIRGIAEQTNLLALNAAIEAARAGESGRGFAVVADEVRSLAQRTQESTGDIQALVERLQREAQNAVDSMHKGSESTKLCLSKSLETAQALQDSSSAVNEITDLNLSISLAAEQQSTVADQINARLVNIKKVAQTTADGSVSVSEANQSIAKQLVGLHANLNQFVV